MQLDCYFFSEQNLAQAVDGVPIQLNDDTIVVVTGFPGSQNVAVNQDIPSGMVTVEHDRFDADFNDQDFDVPIRSGSPSRLISNLNITSPSRTKASSVRPPSRSGTPMIQDGLHIVHSRVPTPQRGIYRSVTPAPQGGVYRAISPAHQPDIDNDFDYGVDPLAPAKEGERHGAAVDGIHIQQFHSGSNSPSRLISIHIISTPAREISADASFIPPASRLGTPFRDGIHMLHSRSVTPAPHGFYQAMSRSVTPAPRLDGDNDFDYAPEPDLTLNQSRVSRAKRQPRKAAREPDAVIDNVSYFFKTSLLSILFF